jgi:hypothetical protein
VLPPSKIRIETCKAALQAVQKQAPTGVFAASLATIAAILMLLISFPNLTPNPNNPVLTYTPPLYPTTVMCGETGSKPEFDTAMKTYNSGDYQTAAMLLEKVVAAQPNSWAGWSFLGVCRYMEKKPEAAVAALTHADTLSKFAFKSEIRWFLMQSYLLDHNIAAADSVHKQLSAMKTMYAAKSDSLWAKIPNSAKR